jgi:AraC-like DNA-binding protein
MKYICHEHWTNEMVFPDADFPLAIKPDDQTVPAIPHSHESNEIVYVTKGTGQHHIAKNNEGKDKTSKQQEYSYSVMAGDVFLVDRRDIHTYTNTGGLEIINIVFLPSVIKGEIEQLGAVEGLFEFLVIEPWFRAETGFGQKVRLKPAERGEMQMLISRISAELEGRKSGYRNMARALFVMLLVFIGRSYASAYSSKPKAADLAGKRSAVEQAMLYIEQNYAKALSLASISNNVFLSPNYFCEMFKSSTGISPWEYLIYTRLEEAKRLLSANDRKISDISLSVGFSDKSYFAKVFKSREGCSPQEFRKKALSTHGA